MTKSKKLSDYCPEKCRETLERCGKKEDPATREVPSTSTSTSTTPTSCGGDEGAAEASDERRRSGGAANEDEKLSTFAMTFDIAKKVLGIALVMV